MRISDWSSDVCSSDLIALVSIGMSEKLISISDGSAKRHRLGLHQAGPGRAKPGQLFWGGRASAFAGGRLRQRARAAQWLCSRLFSAGARAPLHRETK